MFHSRLTNGVQALNGPRARIPAGGQQQAVGSANNAQANRPQASQDDSNIGRVSSQNGAGIANNRF